MADAIKRARQCGLVVMLIVIDNPQNEQSITEIKVKILDLKIFQTIYKMKL